MNIDRSLVARAFSKAGEEPITDTEWEEGTSNRVRVVKEFYLATFEEALSSYDWTSQKKRTRLTPMTAEEIEEGGEENLTEYSFMYMLPADCAKVISINDGDSYIVEGCFLFCNSESAVILYVQNYFTGKYLFDEVRDPVADDIEKYYVIDTDGNYEKAGSTSDMSATYYVIHEEDYNFYGQPKLDPELSAYIECKLAASIALKLTGGTDKYQMLYNEARLIADGAMKRSAEQARNKHKGNPWWTDQLELTKGGNI